MVSSITCTKCHKIKFAKDFFKRNYDGKNGRCSHCKDCRRIADATHRKRTVEQHKLNRLKIKPWINSYNKTRYGRVRLLMIDAYGGKCNCCGERNTRFLTIDHINNDGYKERGNRGIMFKLRRLGWPKDIYQLLCWNCNCGRAANGGICPHKGKAWAV